MLVRHARTAAVRRAAFPVDEPLDERGRADAAALVGTLSAPEVLCSPARRARETCAALGLDEPVEDPALAECDFGTWAGRTLAEVHADDPGGVTAWMTDPEAAPHGGESLRTFAARVAGWMGAQADRDGGAIVVTHGGVVRTAVAHALDAPVQATWRIDVTPLRVTELHAHDGRWTVANVNVPAAAAVASSRRERRGEAAE